jgi:anti-sigma factor RsiW
MKHETFHELLALRLYGELSTEEERLLEEHLASCADCAGFASELETTLGAFAGRRTSAAGELPTDWSERLRAATREKPAPRRLQPVATFVAGLAAGLLVMAALRPASGPPLDEGRVTVVTNAVEEPGFPARATPPPRTTSRGDLAQLSALLWR